MVAFSFVQPDTDEIHNWFISARETKACWKTWPRPLSGIIELPYTFFLFAFFAFFFFSRRFFIAIFLFPFLSLFVLFFFFILYFSFPRLRAKVSSTRVQRAFFRGNWNRTRFMAASNRAYSMAHGFYEPLFGPMMGQVMARVKLAARKT